MKMQLGLLSAISVLALCSCNREAEPTVVTIFENGNKYRIIDRGDTEDQGKSAYFVRYYSKNPADAQSLEAEHAVMYTVIAKHLDTNEYERVVIETVAEKGRLFGIMKPIEVRDSKSVEDVMEYIAKEKANLSK